MSKYKFVTGLVVLLIFASVSFSIALTSTSKELYTASSTSTTKILKVVGIVKMITSNTLYLDNNKQYNLSNVKVTYNKGKINSKKKQKAEMFFVNDVLKEVTIN
jgi:cytochrome c-type biogenesis protein CcmE